METAAVFNKEVAFANSWVPAPGNLPSKAKKMLLPGWCITPGGGVLDISLGGEVRRGPSYPDPV